MPVRTMPGDTVLARMPSRPNSCASTWQSMMTAALLGPYAPRLAWALLPDMDPTATMAPPPALSAGCAALARSQVARTLTANIASQSASG